MDANQIIVAMTATGYILWGVSEILALIPTVKANSIFQAARNVIKAMVRK